MSERPNPLWADSDDSDDSVASDSVACPFCHELIGADSEYCGACDRALPPSTVSDEWCPYCGTYNNDPHGCDARCAKPKTETRMARLTYGDLRRLILEATPDGAPAGESGTSLDAQVDRFLAQYESEAKQQKQEGFDFRRLVRRLVNEAEGDEGEQAPTAPPAEPAGKATIDDIDVESFANSVVRLIDNYDSLLEVRSTLVRRATNFLAKAYDDDVTKQFETVLREEHGIVPGQSKDQVDDDQFVAPAADRAGDGGSGPGAGPGG